MKALSLFVKKSYLWRNIDTTMAVCMKATFRGIISTAQENTHRRMVMSMKENAWVLGSGIRANDELLFVIWWWCWFLSKMTFAALKKRSYCGNTHNLVYIFSICNTCAVHFQSNKELKYVQLSWDKILNNHPIWTKRIKNIENNNKKEGVESTTWTHVKLVYGKVS